MGRTQGLMLPSGNPQNIRGLEGLRYVNRQKGSGTRILIDYLCRKTASTPQKSMEAERFEGHI